jgi:RNA polymerase sigma factor (sigma-70 family)
MAKDSTAELERLYEERYHRLLRVAEAIIRDAELAHDAVQEAFTRLIKHASSFRGEGSLEGWVWRTVVNTSLSVRRDRPAAQPELDDYPDDVRPDANADVRAVVAALPERQRLVLFLRYYADLDYRRIAEALDVEPGTVGATLNQAHAAVRRLLQEAPR